MGRGAGRDGQRFHVTPRDEASQRVIGALQNVYRKKLRPVEEAFFFGQFHYDAITDTELEAKSQVLVIGQYSTGKTTFIRHLLGADFPNMNIGPEPTTDKFTVVIHGQEDRPVAGNSLAVVKELPYEGLSRFGPGLLDKLDAAISTSPFLENITLVDTPGVLSGEMQMHQRAYSFADVSRWFGDRSDLILVLFDAHRLDVSDELMEILMRLKDHQSSIRIVLNKADQVDKAELRRVYGALMWSLGKVFDNPEVVRVYIGSFWDQPLKHTAHEKLFETDQESLTRELTDLPRLSATRKINQLIKRTNSVRAHACVLSYLREQTPWMYGRARRREDLLDNMEGVLETVRAKHGLHEADMPDADALRANLQSFDFASFPILTPAALRQLRHVVDVDIHQVLQEGGGSAKIFKFSNKRGRPQRAGMLSRVGSSIRQLLGGGAESDNTDSSSGRGSPPLPAPAPLRTPAPPHLSSEGVSAAGVAVSATSTAPVTAAPTPTSTPAAPAPAAPTAAAPTPPASAAPAAPTPTSPAAPAVPAAPAAPAARAAAAAPAAASPSSRDDSGTTGVSEESPEKFEEIWTAVSLDESGISGGGGVGGAGGGGESGTRGTGGKRAKKGGFTCCSCLQVLLLVLIPLVALLLFAPEPEVATGTALTDHAARARRFLATTARSLQGTGQAPNGEEEDDDYRYRDKSEEAQALYRGTVH